MNTEPTIGMKFKMHIYTTGNQDVWLDATVVEILLHIFAFQLAPVAGDADSYGVVNWLTKDDFQRAIAKEQILILEYGRHI